MVVANKVGERACVCAYFAPQKLKEALDPSTYNLRGRQATTAAMENEEFGTPIVHVNAEGWGPDSRYALVCGCARS